MKKDFSCARCRFFNKANCRNGGIMLCRNSKIEISPNEDGEEVAHCFSFIPDTFSHKQILKVYVISGPAAIGKTAIFGNLDKVNSIVIDDLCFNYSKSVAEAYENRIKPILRGKDAEDIKYLYLITNNIGDSFQIRSLIQRLFCASEIIYVTFEKGPTIA